MRRRSLLRRIGGGTGTVFVGTLAGCADLGSDGSQTDAPEETEMGMADVAVGFVAPFGNILVDGDGLTLYLFTQDSDGESSCYDQCAENWPPLTVEGDPTAGEDVTAELGTTERDDGSMQVTAAGNPLYYFVNDSEPGDANGQGVGDVWYVLTPDGTRKTSDGSGGGY